MAAVIIIEAIEIIEDLEKVKGYWDEKGLDMHIAVKENGWIAVSTKHWGRVHYLKTNDKPYDLWQTLKQVAQEVGRSLVKSVQGPYVFIPKLGKEQTQNVFNIIRSKLGQHKIERKFEFSWDIDDAVLEEFCKPKEQ